jgi:hypothetical protein
MFKSSGPFVGAVSFAYVELFMVIMLLNMSRPPVTTCGQLHDFPLPCLEQLLDL